MSTGRPRRAAHTTPVRRLPILVVVLAVLVLAGLVGRTSPAPAPPAAALLGTVAPPTGAESSSWYCTGGTGTQGGSANVTLYLFNRGPTAVTGSVTVANDTGGTGVVPVTVAPGAQITVVPGLILQGTWLASRVDLNGGGVSVSEVVDGAYGWAQSPCASTTSASWYFASGATINGSTLFVALYNPSATASVVNLAFATPQGLTQPTPFQGLVVAPGQLVVAGVAAYVQNQSSVSTVVQATSGRIVAQELQEFSANGISGLSLRLGSTQPAARSYFPRSVDVTGGRTSFSVFNPGQVPEHVTIAVRLPSGPVAPFVQDVPADSTWVQSTTASGTAADRVPDNQDFATTVTAVGGPGVVVDRTVASSSAGATPQWGEASAVPGDATTVASRQWLLPNPALAAQPPVTGAAPFALALLNTGTTTVTVTVSVLGANGPTRLGSVPPQQIAPGAFSVIEAPALAAAGMAAFDVQATGPVAVMSDATPAGMPGVVAMPGIPQG
ncbi:MAG: DUF5719 family protein [Acidimicrobiales bacterium]